VRVLLVDDTLDIGGKERQTVVALKCLTGLGIETHMGFLSSPGKLGGEAVALADGHAVFGRRNPLSPSAVRALKDYVVSREIDLVHCNGVVDSLHAFLACRNLDVRLVCTVHGYEHGMHLAVHRYVLSRFHAVVAVSNAFLEDLRKAGYGSGLFRVIPNSHSGSAPPSPVHRESRPGEPLKMVMISRFDWSKDQLTAARALELLRAQGTDARLDFVGSGTERYISPVEDFVCENELEDRVRLRGEIRDLPAILPDYDLMVMSSSAESFGIALVEGMAWGLPVVASDIPPFREITSEGRFGLHFRTGDHADLARILETLASDPGRLDELSGLALERAADYSPEAFGNRTLSLYEELLRDVGT
jgi:glycosyltransferase involved in cell wall biosynthesis